MRHRRVGIGVFFVNRPGFVHAKDGVDDCGSGTPLAKDACAGAGEIRSESAIDDRRRGLTAMHTPSPLGISAEISREESIVTDDAVNQGRRRMAENSDSRPGTREILNLQTY